MDFEVKRCTRRCAATERELGDGETFFSVLIAEGGEVVRYDYCAEAWQGPPQAKVVGWWKSQMPTRETTRARMAPNDVLLQYFHELEGQPQQADVLYVLALLLVRRRVMRLEEAADESATANVLSLYCPREEANYQVPVVAPNDARVDEIQEELAKLLFATGT